MSWNTTPTDVQQAALNVLTDKQLQAWKLELAGLSLRKISRHLGISRTTTTDRLEAAHRTLRQAGVHQTEHGAWSLTQKEPD